VLVLNCLFSYFNWVPSRRISHFLLVGCGYLTAFLFLTPLGSVYHARTFISRQNCPSINNGIDPNYLGLQRFSHLDIPTKYQYRSGITILIPLGRFFDTIIHVDY
jgi:hypothetical protein